MKTALIALAAIIAAAFVNPVHAAQLDVGACHGGDYIEFHVPASFVEGGGVLDSPAISCKEYYYRPGRPDNLLAKKEGGRLVGRIKKPATKVGEEFWFNFLTWDDGQGNTDWAGDLVRRAQQKDATLPAGIEVAGNHDRGRGAPSNGTDIYVLKLPACSK